MAKIGKHETNLVFSIFFVGFFLRSAITVDAAAAACLMSWSQQFCCAKGILQALLWLSLTSQDSDTLGSSASLSYSLNGQFQWQALLFCFLPTVTIKMWGFCCLRISLLQRKMSWDPVLQHL